MPWFLAILLSSLTGFLAAARQGQPALLWQADLVVRSATVSAEKGNLTLHVVIGSDFGEALGARVEVLLPVGVGIVSLGAGCVPGPSPTGISALRARVECTLGNLTARSSRSLVVVTTTPPNGVVRGFAVVAMSDTPDPKPGNNFAERILPLP